MRVQLSWAVRLTLFLGIALTLTLGSASAAPAAVGVAGLQSDLAGQLRLAGPADGAYVYDLTTHQVLFSERATTMRAPASVEKLFTAAGALERLGPEYRLATTVFGSGHLAPGGVWEGSLYLHGGGDPTFGSSAFIARHYGGLGSSVSTVAKQLKAAGIARVSGQVLGDESMFDSLRGEPSSDYAPDPFLEGSLSALAFNRGETGRERGAHAPAAYAARQLRVALRAAGVHVSGSGGAVAGVPAGALQLASLPSPTVAQLVGLMLPPSDNFFAEMLVKAMGARLAGAGTTPAGAGVVSATVSSQLGIHPRIYDGSGLSEANRTSPYQVADMLVELYPTAIGALLRSKMAVAGRTGTLEKRMRRTAAAGRCVGKTGTLTGVSNLVGYCPSSDGHMLAFAIFNDGVGVTTARTVQDHIAITLASSAP
ncbi:MAG TPA: D-alanyl-D-alanine carboxypeptidase [Solirubrobacteraceae bacterium]|nr:D-alanyl-D-alanine carboxypeptidase [Solirubrobacteraceae bacterium]